MTEQQTQPPHNLGNHLSDLRAYDSSANSGQIDIRKSYAIIDANIDDLAQKVVLFGLPGSSQ